MFGTVARMTVKAGELEQLQKVLSDWDGASVDGAIATYVYKPENGTNDIMFSVLFRDEESHNANARSPRTAEWYQAVRSHLDADPEWWEGPVIVAREY